VASPSEKDDVDMTTQHVFKHRVRARMAKTGEAYTTARLQLLRQATRAPEAGPDPARERRPVAAADLSTNLVSGESMVRATGHGHDHWSPSSTRGAQPVERTRRSPPGSMERTASRAGGPRTSRSLTSALVGCAVTLYAKGDGRSIVSVSHERLEDAATGDRMKSLWREGLATLSSLLGS
jgi:hypothetical protein